MTPDPKALPSPDDIEAQKAKEYQEKMQKLSKTLGIDLMKEDAKEMRTKLDNVSAGVQHLLEQLDKFNKMQGQPQPPQEMMQQMTDEEMPPEQKLLAVKEILLGIGDVVKSFKGTPVPQGVQQQNMFQNLIMDSFAQMIKAKVDETMFGTYGSVIPPDQMKLLMQWKQMQANQNNPSQPFEK